MKLRLYLDTSVFSALFDDRAPDRLALTEEFWKTLPDYDHSTSDLAVEELRQTADPQLRANMESLLTGFQITPVTDEIRNLADQYIQAGAFTRSMLNDAVHVAAATLSRQDILVSWNFKHLVNRRRRATVCSVNAREGLPVLDILSPPEL
ncbi:MAG: PIN domain-containing protein [Limisphaerales bacterium]